jgi:hypothetical protein
MVSADLVGNGDPNQSVFQNGFAIRFEGNRRGIQMGGHQARDQSQTRAESKRQHKPSRQNRDPARF